MSKIWKCDFEDCEEIAQWYRKRKGQLVKLCTKHEAYLSKEHWGKRVDFSELDENNISYLERKEYKRESVKRIPFEITLRFLEDRTIRVLVRDRQTNEWRSFVVKNTDDLEGIDKISRDLEEGKFSKKPSIHDFVKMLEKAVSDRKE